MSSARAPVVALSLVAALGAAGAEVTAEPPWEMVATRPIVVKVRARPGTQVKETWATGVIAAPAQDVQDALLDGESFPRFMPYVKEVRKLDVPSEDGSFFTYQRVAPPLVAPRDCVFQVWVDQSLSPDGTGAFRNHWKAVPGLVPSAEGAVRTQLSEGSWEVVPLADGRSRAVYRFTVDPGGQIPPWLADLGNRTGIADVFRALEGEAKRRAAERLRTKAQARALAASAGSDAGVVEAAAPPGPGPASPASP